MRDSGETSILADVVYRPATRQNRLIAVGLIVFFAIFTAIAMIRGGAPAPQAPAFVPICATLWAAADLMTTFLLLSQFAVTGLRSFAIIGAAYAVVAILSIPYIAFFPAVFTGTGGAAFADVSPLLFIGWHIIFPLAIAAYHLHDSELTKRSNNRGQMLGMTFAIMFAVVLIVTVGSIVSRGALPPLVVNGRFTPVLNVFVFPAVTLLNVAAAVLIYRRARKLSALQVWLIVVLAIGAFEMILNLASAGRFTVGWYLAKFETLAQASIVFAALSLEVSGMYRRLGDLAMTDPLTGLRNRRSFDDYTNWNIESARRSGTELAFLVVDIDYFKRYNDRYGHAAGDVCLKRVAGVLSASLGRAVDIVARYGGEEFVALLPGATALSARQLAERIRGGVAALGIDHRDSSVAPIVTVSVGVVHARSLSGVDTAGLFTLADKALYRAKERRNSTVLAETGFAASPSELKWQIRLLKNKGA